MMLAIDKRTQLMLGVAVAAIGIVTMPASATAPQPPQLVLSRLNGRSIHVLYLTRSSDRVLVRCYPGLQPRVTIAQQTAGIKEGSLTCGN